MSEFVLITRPMRKRRLPVRELVWMPDRRADCTTAAISRRSAITQPGYRKGQKPPNWGKRYPPDPLTPSECLRVLEACGGGKLGTRNRALIVLLWRAGLRIHEALLLKPHHVDFEQMTVTVLRGKGGKRRVVGIDLWALEQLQDWYAMRARLKLPPDSPLICTVSRPNAGQPVHSAYARALCHKLGRKAGIAKRVHPHGFRHAHACDLVREGTSVHLVSRQLGHSNLAVTATYLAGIAPEEVVKAIAGRPAPGVQA